MNATTTPASNGLSAGEARRRLLECGPNTMPDVAVHPLRNVLAKFWAPVPWMLEATILLELFLGKFVEAAIIAALLVFNAALGFFQESRAQATLAALKSRLALDACVRRDNAKRSRRSRRQERVQSSAAPRNSSARRMYDCRGRLYAALGFCKGPGFSPSQYPLGSVGERGCR
jgi:hypothetical protein